MRLAALALALAAETAHAGPGLHVGYSMGPTEGAGDAGFRGGTRLGLGYAVGSVEAIADSDLFYVGGGGTLGIRAGIKGRVRIGEIRRDWDLHAVAGAGRQWYFADGVEVAAGDDALIGLAASAESARMRPIELSVEVLVASLRAPRSHASHPRVVPDPDGAERSFAATLLVTLGVRLGR